MSQQFVETIRIQNGRVMNIRYHEDRMHRTQNAVFDIRERTVLRPLIQIPADINSKLIKCRVIYGMNVESITYEPYTRKPIRSLQLIDIDRYTYSHKSTDRVHLSHLFSQKEEGDDILMVKHLFRQCSSP